MHHQGLEKRKDFTVGNSYVFAGLWLLTFIIYAPAMKAGWVIDASGWLYTIRNMDFWSYIHRTHSVVPSLYQVTQFTTWVFYQVFKANPYAWHLLQVSMHTLNAYLIYRLFAKLFADAKLEQPKLLAIVPVLLYSCTPHLSEVIVWEASFHYLQGFLFILLILNWLLLFLRSGKTKYAWLSGLVFLISTYSLEVFYMTPWYVLCLILFYRLALKHNAGITNRALLCFFVPQLVLFGAHLWVLQIVYDDFAHIAESAVQPIASYLSKPPLYVFHILLLGRFFPHELRKQVYSLFQSTPGLITFYFVFLASATALIRTAVVAPTPYRSLLLLFLGWVGVSAVILLPLAFPFDLLLFYDRYSYYLSLFLITFCVLALYGSGKHLVPTLLLLPYLGINLFFTTKLNLYWKDSTYVDNRLLHTLPDNHNKTVVLLNIPENMAGVPMIGAQPGGQYQAMMELLTGKKIAQQIYDAASYNMVTKDDGAHVQVINDSVVHVILNQWGTWWWYEGHGGRSYTTPYYKLDMTDGGHNYELILRKPADSLLLLYSVGAQWKPVDMSKKGQDQY
jgi:hypothetical protein